MAGANSILFDIDAIVDMEATAICYLSHEWPNIITNADYLTDINIKIKRIYGPSLFESVIDQKYCGTELMYDMLERDQKEIFESNHVCLTDIATLLSAYKKTGGGLIKTTIRCDNEFQKEFISRIDSDLQVIVQARKDVDTTRYGRIFTGSCRKAIEYELNEPKSIVVLNFIENFDKMYNDRLISEFILVFGDIHSIQITNAYRLDDIEG